MDPAPAGSPRTVDCGVVVELKQAHLHSWSMFIPRTAQRQSVPVLFRLKLPFACIELGRVCCVLHQLLDHMAFMKSCPVPFEACMCL
jgi:hypothetical protein